MTGHLFSRHVSVGTRALAACCAIALCAAGVVVRAQGGAAGLEVLQLRPNFYVLVGAGANIAAQIGRNGVLLVNAGTAAASADVIAAVKKLSSEPIRYIIDTSADPDVVGGNDQLAKAGRRITSFAVGPNRMSILGTDVDIASVFSHESVLTRMSRSAPSGQESSFGNELWPSETFAEPRRTMSFNGEGIEILHLPGGHTDTDTIVFFRKSDVVVAGNIIDAEHFPVIDVARGGSVQGEIAALNRIIAMAIPPVPFVGFPSGARATDPLDGGTDVVTGHGRVFRQIDVVNYRDMVVVVRDIVEDMIKKKMTLEQIKAADPAKPYRSQYGATSGPWTTNDFVEAIYKSLTRATS